MSDVNMRRSQMILRMPVDHVTAALILHDGARSEVVLFVPPTEDLARVISSGDPFLPVMRGGKICLVARDVIACISVPAIIVIPREDDLPVLTQLATVTLRSGVALEGELRWTAPLGAQRTVDHLNRDEAHVVLHTPDTTHHIVKAHVAIVEER